MRRANHPPVGRAEGLRFGLHQVGGGPEQVFNGGGEGELALQRGPRLGQAGPTGGGGGLVRQVGQLPGPHPAAGLLPPLGSRWPRGAAKEADPKAKVMGGADTTLRTPDQGTRRYPPITTPTLTAVEGEVHHKHLPKDTKHVFLASVACGLVLPSISAWVGKEKFKTTGGLYVQILQGLASRGGTRLLQITGWHRDKATCLQLVMDEPPEQLYNQWIRDRMVFYKRVEPTEPPRDERLVLGEAGTEPLGFVSQPCRMWESCALFPPGPGCFWPRLRGGGKGLRSSLLGLFFTTVFFSCSTRHGSVISTTIGSQALAAPRTGHQRVAAADSWFPGGPLEVLGESAAGSAFPPLCFWGPPPLPVEFSRLWGGPVKMRVACLLHLHSAVSEFGACMHCAAGGSRLFDRRLEPPPFFIMARVSTKFLMPEAEVGVPRE